MFLRAPESRVLPPPVGGSRRCPFSGGLLPVMPPTERGEVGVSVVVTVQNVVHVARRFCAPLPAVIEVRAAKTVAPQNASADANPVSREATTPVRTGPLGRGEYRLTTWKKEPRRRFAGRGPAVDPRRSEGR